MALLNRRLLFFFSKSGRESPVWQQILNFIFISFTFIIMFGGFHTLYIFYFVFFSSEPLLYKMCKLL